MAVRRMHSVIVVLLIMVITGFFVIFHMETVNAYVNPSGAEETAKAEQAASSDTASNSKTESSAKTKKSKSSEQNSSGSNNAGSENDSQSDSDEDVIDENSFSTPGNARLGDVIRDSDSKDFYTIRTENDNTYYLVIDHSGNMDNVYMLSTIDEEDLKDFLGDENNLSGSIVFPEKNVTEETETVEAESEKEPEKNRTSGLISLAIILLAAVGGGAAFLRYRKRSEEPEDDYSENMEDDGLQTINEDEEFL